MSATTSSGVTELPYYSINPRNLRSRSTTSPRKDDFDNLLQRLRRTDPKLAHAVTHFEHRRRIGTLTAIGEPWFTREETLNIMRRALEGTLDEDDDAENVEHEDSPRTAAPADAGTFDGMSDTSDKDHALTQAAQPSSSPSKEDRALLLQAVRLMAQRRKEQERIRDKDRVIGFDGNGDQVNLPSTKRSMVELLGETTLKGKKSRLHLKGSDKDHCGLSSQQSDQERGRKKRSDSGAFEKDFALLDLWKKMGLDGSSDQADPEAMGPAARAERKKLQKEGKLPAEEKPSEAVQKSSRVGNTHCTAIDDKAGVLEKAGDENKASVGDRVSAKLTSLTGK